MEDYISQFIVLSYPDEATAQEAIATPMRLTTEQLINLEDAAYDT